VGAAAPLALFVHGGYWRSLDPSLFSHLARGLNARGLTVAVVGYDLCPIVSIADIIVQIRRVCLFLWQRLGQRMLVCGWSAGGHLAACMVATDWPSLYPKAPADLVPAGYAISGLFDLSPLLKTSINQDLKLDAEKARAVSPQLWPLAPGRIFETVVGALESSEFRRQSRAVAEAWKQGGAETRSAEIAAMNHFTIVDGLADPQNLMTARVAELAQRIKT
jgi:arylformamidase